MIRTKLDGKYPYLPAVVNSKGRIKPGAALVGGVETKVEGSYCLRFTENGNRGWKCEFGVERLSSGESRCFLFLGFN